MQEIFNNAGSECTGQVVYEEHIKPITGKFYKELDVTHLSGGVYMLKVTDSQGLSVMKFIVNR